MPDTTAAFLILAAALGGAAVGVERQWSGHASGPHARFAGIRTFTLLGGLAGVAGWLWGEGAVALATVLLAGGATLVVAAYVAASRDHVDGTTEVAALVVLAAGTLAGTGRLSLASGIVAVTCLLLVEKTRLHTWVRVIDDAGLRAGFRFAVMAIVVLPLLPEGPYGPFGGIRPQALWALVLVFSGLSFAGYVARRAVGPRHGYAVAGLLGGMISSTSVTFVHARASAAPHAPGLALACGVVAASTVMFARVLVATALLHWPLAVRLAPLVLLPFVVGALAALALWRRAPAPARTLEPPANPLAVASALPMAIAFQLALMVITAVHARFGALGLMASGAALGATDVDALTFSMVQAAAAGTSLALVTSAMLLGTVANTVLKLVVALALGRGAFRVAAAVGLVVMALAAGLPLVLLTPWD